MSDAETRAKPAKRKPKAKTAATTASKAKVVARPAAEAAPDPQAKAKPKAPPKAKAGPRAKPASNGASTSKPRTRAKAKTPTEPAVIAKTARIEESAAPVAVTPTDGLAPDASPIPAALPNDKGLGWASTVIVTATAFLFLFNAPSLKNWADQQAPNRATVAIRNLADGWYDTTERLGLSAPRAALHDAWNKAVAAKWGGGNSADP